MKRSEVYRAIDSERAYQRARGLPDERQTQQWLDSIDYYLERAWLEGEDNKQDRLVTVRKIAALAVAALEQYGASPREGYEAATLEQAPALERVPGDVLEAMKYVYSKYMLSSSGEPLGGRHEFVNNMVVIGNYLDRVGAWSQRPASARGQEDRDRD